MVDQPALKTRLHVAVTKADNAAQAAAQLCAVCVACFEVDGATLSFIHGGDSQGTVGSSGDLGVLVDELQFTFGEGPGLDAVRTRAPVLVPDLDDPDEHRWPVLRGAVLASGVRAIFALPVGGRSASIGVLDLVRRDSGALSEEHLTGLLLATRLAAGPLLDLSTPYADATPEAAEGRVLGWDQLERLDRTEIYQATGMIIGAFEVGPTEALLRLRGFAIAQGMTASEMAWEIVERRVVLDRHEWRYGPGLEWGHPG